MEDPKSSADGPTNTGNVVGENKLAEKNTCGWIRFEDVNTAQGYAFTGFGSGSVVMSQVFLSAAFIFLASEEAGCLDEDDEIDEDCENRVYGFYPATVVTNISAIAGLLAAIIMPFMGALVDYTSYRKRAGIYVAIPVVVIQFVQIGTNSRTWFVMGILQALGLALVEIHYFLTVAYLPDVARSEVSYETMSKFSQNFLSLQFSGQLVYLILIVGISIALGLNTTQTAQVGQLVGGIWVGVSWYMAWCKFPHVEGQHHLSDAHHSLFAAGFRQNWKTCVRIYQQSQSLTWFLMFICFMEAGTSAIIPVAVTYLSRVLDYNGTEIGLAFVCALVGSIPGAIFGGWMSRLVNPLNALKINGITNIIITTFGTVVITQSNRWTGYLWGFLWGFVLCWFYAGEQIFYSFCIPKGQDTELSGFFVFCTIVLVWLPPLIFTIVIESGVEERWGLTSLVAVQVMGMLALTRVPAWNKVLEGAKHSLVLDIHDDDVADGNVAQVSQTEEEVAVLDEPVKGGEVAVLDEPVKRTDSEQGTDL